jgi:hypothetical protein
VLRIGCAALGCGAPGGRKYDQGHADDYSDLDVFVEVERLDKHLKGMILDSAWDIGFSNLMVIAPLIFTRDELENTPLRSSPIVKVIFAEGAQV